MDTVRGNSDEYDVKLATIAQRQTGLEGEFRNFANNVSSQLSSLSTKLDERGRTPWATLISGFGVILAVVGALGTLALTPIIGEVGRLQRDADQSVDLDQYKEFKGTLENQRLIGRQDYDNKILNINNTISDLARLVVPRGENEEHWRAIDTAMVNVQRQLDEVKSTYAGTYSLKDAIANMQRQIERLELEKAALPLARPPG